MSIKFNLNLGKETSITLLMRLQTGPDTLEINMENSQKAKNKSTK